MKQISIFDFYLLGKSLEPLFQLDWTTPVNDGGFAALAAYRQLKEVVREDSVFPKASRAAATALMTVLEKHFGDGLEVELPTFYEEDSRSTMGSNAEEIVAAVKEFDTVFKNDVPSMTVFSAEKKGIYSTLDLIDHADDHFPAWAAKNLPAQARTDILAAGRCLAFNVPTATAFHVWRALEVVFGEYFVVLTGKTFEEVPGSRNWGAYIKALNGAGADKKITGNLDHIREEYRNPVMHPNINVSPEEAFSLFGVGVSAISQLMQAMHA